MSTANTQGALVFERVTKQYGKVVAVNDVSFSIPQYLTASADASGRPFLYLGSDGTCGANTSQTLSGREFLLDVADPAAPVDVTPTATLPVTAMTPPLSDTSDASGRSPGAAPTVAAPRSPLAPTTIDLLKNLDVVANAVAGKFALTTPT